MRQERHIVKFRDKLSGTTRRIQRRINTIILARIVNLRKIYISLRDDMSVLSDWFKIVRAKLGGFIMRQERYTVKSRDELPGIVWIITALLAILYFGGYIIICLLR